ncbi:MAG: coiled coil domain-containing protein [Alphaproteobacteria bacterium]|nr:coiled coil domain-containing protein [Alphaproteobacteria bacterium]
MALRDAYMDKLDAQLREAEAEVERLNAKANTARADNRVEYEKQIANLKARQEKLKEEIVSLRKAGEEAWQDLVTGAETAWTDLRTAVRSASQRF